MPPTITIQEVDPNLSLQEEALATAMLHRIGNATVNFAIGQDGIRYHNNPSFEAGDFDSLVTEFRHDPKESLAWARESLIAINSDNRLSPSEKGTRLDRYLDAYFDLTLKLDHAAFPKSEPGHVEEGVPEYVPDGLVDMGGDSDTDPEYRRREMIMVDKAGILAKFKPTLKDIFSQDFAGVSSGKKKKFMAAKTAQDNFNQMPYSEKKLGGDMKRLSEIEDMVCRHHSLVFQVLGQAVGLKTQLLKSKVEWGDISGRHASNLLRVNGSWFIMDVAAPDHVKLPNGQNEWRPGMYPIDAPPRSGESKEWKFETPFAKHKRTYRPHESMYWFIDDTKIAR